MRDGSRIKRDSRKLLRLCMSYIASDSEYPVCHAAERSTIMKTLYTIKPLEWVEDGQDWWKAMTPFGNYNAFTSSSVWTWYFSSEGFHPCSSFEDAKRLAEADWLKRISAALDEYWRNQH
jgi:hypothetical protein